MMSAEGMIFPLLENVMNSQQHPVNHILGMVLRGLGYPIKKGGEGRHVNEASDVFPDGYSAESRELKKVMSQGMPPFYAKLYQGPIGSGRKKTN